MRKMGLGWVALCMACIGCGGEEPLVKCDPFDARTEPIRLASVSGAGVDANGTIYVMGGPPGDAQAFISRDGELFRERVTAENEAATETVYRTVFSLSELELPLTLQLEQEQQKAGGKHLGVWHGPLADDHFTLGADNELQLVPNEELLKLPVHNYPTEVLVKFTGTLPDGQSLVVVSPRDYAGYDRVRVFFGPTERLIERQVQSAGSSWTIEFELDGTRATARLQPADGDEAAPTLEHDGEVEALTLEAEPVSPVGATYYCAR